MRPVCRFSTGTGPFSWGATEPSGFGQCFDGGCAAEFTASF